YWMLRTRTRNPAVFVCLALAAISYFPVSGIFALNASVAEHWIYLPSAWLFLAVAVQLAAPGTTRLRRSRIAIATLVFVLWFAFLGTRTFIRTFDWKDGFIPTIP